MVNAEDMQTLRVELEVLREQQLQGRLDHERVWAVHERVTELLDAADESPYQDTLEVIYNLIDSLWMTKLGQHRMNAAYRGLQP